MRSALLNAADSRPMQRFMYRHGMSLGARRFVAGETLDEFLRVVQSVNDRGFVVAAGLLGEGVAAERDAASVVHEYQHILRRLANLSLRSNIALKLTHLGLGIRQQLALDNVRTIVSEAQPLDNFVRMDMEQSAYTDATLTIYRQLRDEGHRNVGTVLQAYLRRSESDLRLAAAAPAEPSPCERCVSRAARHRLPQEGRCGPELHVALELALSSPGFTAIATHDQAIIEQTIALIRGAGSATRPFRIPDALRRAAESCRNELRDAVIASARRSVRIAVVSVFYARLAERPANLFLLQSLWRG